MNELNFDPDLIVKSLEIGVDVGKQPDVSVEQSIRECEDLSAQNAVNMLVEQEHDRRQWCVQVTLSSYSLETNESNFLKIANKIYDYVYGTRVD